MFSLALALVLGVMAIAGVGATKPGLVYAHEKPAPWRGLQEVKGGLAHPDVAGVGFALGPDPSFNTLEDAAGYWEALGISAASHGFDGDSYHIDRDNATLRHMSATWNRDIKPLFDDAVLQVFGRRNYFKPRLVGAIDSQGIGPLPLHIQKEMLDLTMKDKLLVEGPNSLPRIPVDEETYNWASIATKDPAIFDVSEVPVVADQDDVKANQRLSVKRAYAKVRFTGLGERLAQGKSTNLFNNQVARRIDALNELVESELLTGTGAGGGFNGMRTMFTDNVEDNLGTDLELVDIKALLKKTWLNGGAPDLGIVSHDLALRIATLNEPQNQIVLGQQTEAIGGFAGVRNQAWYYGMPWRASRFVNNGAATMELFAYQSNLLKMPVLLDVTMMPLGATTDAQEWLIKWYLMGLADDSASAAGTPAAPGAGSGGRFHGKLVNADVP